VDTPTAGTSQHVVNTDGYELRLMF